MPRANIVLSMVGMMAPSVRVRRDDSARAEACGIYPTDCTASAIRMRNSALTEFGLLSARDTEAVETPARVATARIPCFDDLPECGSIGHAQSIYCNVTRGRMKAIHRFVQQETTYESWYLNLPAES